jgi:hypothetical protein
MCAYAPLVGPLVNTNFCWIVCYHEHAYPREGHVLWITSMLLALFSESTS